MVLSPHQPDGATMPIPDYSPDELVVRVKPSRRGETVDLADYAFRPAPGFAASNIQSDPEGPLEDWYLSVADRCARRRALKLCPANPQSVFDLAAHVVTGMFEARLHDLLKGVPRATEGTTDLVIRFRIDWTVYRDLARTADDRLAGLFHSESPSSPSSVATIAEAGEAGTPSVSPVEGSS